MNIASIVPGTHIVAVSGGVDSVVLLHLLAARKDLALIVAHFDHGIRSDSADDARFVRQLAKRYNLPFVAEKVSLGQQASEEAARKARYVFLERARIEHRAQTIIIAHHQDDLLETAVINMLRGTGWRGLCSLRTTATRSRPLLAIPKSDITAFAQEQGLEWRTDSTNCDVRYLRNRVRRDVLSRFSDDKRQQLLALIARQMELRQDIEEDIDTLLCSATLAQDATRPLLGYATWHPCLSDTGLRAGGASYSVLKDRGCQLLYSHRYSDISASGNKNLIAGALGATAIGNPPFAKHCMTRYKRGVLCWQKGVPSSVTGTDISATFLRLQLICLPSPVAKELLLAVVYKLTSRRVEGQMLRRMYLFVKTARPHKTLQVSGRIELRVAKTTVVVRAR